MTPEQIKHARQSLGLTQAEMAEKMGIKTSKLTQWEIGRYRISDEGSTLISILSGIKKQ